MSDTALINTENSMLPLLPLRDVVVFPHMVIPLFVGRTKSIKALEAAMEAGKSIVLVEHNMAIIRRICDHLIVMDAGKLLAEGHPEKVLSEKAVLEAYLGE